MAPFGKKDKAPKKEKAVTNPPEYVSTTKPPLLEDVAVEGPLRVHVPTLKTMSIHIRDVVEEDYGWWRYSKMAAPCLFILLALVTTVLCLTLWQHNGSLKEMYAGVPRDLYHADQHDDDAEGRYPFVNAAGQFDYDQGVGNRHRNLRVTYITCGLAGVFFVYAAYFLRLAPKLRMVVGLVAALLWFIGAGCAFYTFGATMGKADNVYETSWDWRYTRQRVESREDYETVQVICDISFAILALITLFHVVFYGYKGYFKLRARGWRLREREDAAEFVKPQNRKQQPGKFDRVSYTYSGLTHFFLISTTIVLIISAAFVILNFVTLRTTTRSGYQNGDLELSGWPIVNQRVRIAACAIGILTILLNLLPIRSRFVNMVWAFLLFVTACLLFTGFAMDIVELNRTAGGDGDSSSDFEGAFSCPIDPSTGAPFRCSKNRFIYTAAFTLIAAIFILFYLLLEVFGRKPCKWCGRGYSILDFSHASECSKREVTCEICQWTGPAGLWYYKHRGQCDQYHTKCQHCDMFVPQHELRRHSDECPFWPVRCTMCNMVFRRMDMPQHTAVCPKRRVNCDACGEPFIFEELKAHKEVCLEVEVTCDLCGRRMQRAELNTHLQYDCQYRHVQCQMCGQLVPQAQLAEHQARQCEYRLLQCDITGETIIYKDRLRHLDDLRARGIA
jgi:hypothetical protein